MAQASSTQNVDLILASERVFAEVEELVEAEPAGSHALKGFAKPVSAYSIVDVKPPAEPGESADGVVA